MIVYIPIAILTIILFIFLIKWQRKKAQKKRIASEKYEDGVIVQQIKTRRELFMAIREWHQNAKMAEKRYGHISAWNVSKVTNMQAAFRMMEWFNEDISKWDVSNVTNMSGMFRNATTFNQDISSWNVSNVTDMRGMFYGASEFNQNIGSWDVSSVINMNDILTGADKLSVKEKVERLINKWDFSEHINLANFFSGADIDNYIEYRSIEDIISKDPVYQNKEEADAALSIEKNVKCDDGVTRRYNGFMYGIIKERESDSIVANSIIPYELNIDKGVYGDSFRNGPFHINNEKWFSEEGTSLNAKEILILMEVSTKRRQEYNTLKPMAGETTATLKINYAIKYVSLVCINNIFFYTSTRHFLPEKSPNFLFSGTIDDKKYKDGVIVQPKNKETDTSDKIDFDEFEGFVPFEEVIDNMKEILGTEVFEIFGLVGYTNSESGYIASDKNNTTSDEETLLKAFFEKYKVLYACFSLVAKEEKMDISSVMDLIYPDLKKTPSWVSNASEVSQSTIHMLFYSSRTNDLNNKAFEDFEKKDYNKGLAKAAESLFLLFLHPSKIFAFKSDMAIYLDTLGWGLFLNQQFLHSATVHTKSIALDSDSDNIAIHLFNRGMALYSMVSPTEIGIDLDDKQLDFKQRNIDLAKADFQKALEKNSSFEQAQEMLESLNR